MEAYIRFIVHCGKCNQRLSVSKFDATSQTYSHENADDCDGRSIELPSITPEQLAAFFTTAPAKPAKKAASKKIKK